MVAQEPEVPGYPVLQFLIDRLHCNDRQVNREKRSLANFAFYRDRTATGLHDTVYHRQSKTCSFSPFFGRKIWIEYL